MSSANKEKNGLRKLREGFFGSLGLRALYIVLKASRPDTSFLYHIMTWLSTWMIVRVNEVLNRTVVVDIDRGFDNLCGSRLYSQSELYHVSCRY